VFADMGRGWNKGFPTPPKSTLVGTGPGIRWTPFTHEARRIVPRLELYWGVPLVRVANSKTAPQDYGIHFQAGLSFF